MGNGIHTARYRTDREAKRVEWQRRRRPCNICGQPLNYSLPKDHPEHFQLDHIKSRDKFPDLEFDPANWAPAHASCNKRKSNGEAAPGLGETSEDF